MRDDEIIDLGDAGPPRSGRNTIGVAAVETRPPGIDEE